MQTRTHEASKSRAKTAAATAPKKAAKAEVTKPEKAVKVVAKVEKAEKAVEKAEVKAPVAAPSADGFKVGDKAVYPARGVAEIVAIEEKDIAGKRQRFYVLRLVDTDHKIMVPVGNAHAIGLRRPISEAEVRRIFQILKVKDVPIDTQTWNRRHRAFVEKLSTGSVFDAAEVLRDLERVKDVKEGLSFSERQMLERARLLLVNEIAVSRGKTAEVVRAQIDALFESARPKAPKTN